jgi:hypothetical protein
MQQNRKERRSRMVRGGGEGRIVMAGAGKGTGLGI